MLLSLLAACAGPTDTAEESIAAPTVEWLVPSDGDSVTAGDVPCSVVVSGFTLVDLAKHSEGAPEGYLSVSVDGAEVLATASTNFTLPVEAGAHDLVAQLFYEDGDAVLATDAELCDEDSEDASCAPVAATIALTAE